MSTNYPDNNFVTDYGVNGFGERPVFTDEKIKEIATFHGVDETTVRALERYAVDHIKTGDFLYGVLTNDLAKAISHADHLNAQRIKNVWLLCCSELPGTSWGSKKNVEEWLAGHPKSRWEKDAPKVIHHGCDSHRERDF